MNLRPKEYFQLAPNMRTACIELCIYAMSKSVTYRPGRLRTLAERNQWTRFPGPRAKYYIHLLVGQRSMGLQEYSSRSKVDEGNYIRAKSIWKFTELPFALLQEGRRINI